MSRARTAQVIGHTASARYPLLEYGNWTEASPEVLAAADRAEPSGGSTESADSAGALAIGTSTGAMEVDSGDPRPHAQPIAAKAVPWPEFAMELSPTTDDFPSPARGADLNLLAASALVAMEQHAQGIRTAIDAPQLECAPAVDDWLCE